MSARIFFTHNHMVKALKQVNQLYSTKGNTPVSSSLALSTDCSDYLADLVDYIFTKVLQGSLFLATKRESGRKRILKQDVESCIFIMFPVMISEENKVSNFNIIPSSLIKSHATDILKGVPQVESNEYLNLPSATVEYLENFIISILFFMFNKILLRLYPNGSKRQTITEEHVQHVIAQDKDLSLIFPEEAIRFWRELQTKS